MVPLIMKKIQPSNPNGRMILNSCACWRPRPRDPGNGFLRLGIGAEEDRRKGYGTQALRMLLRFAFAELNLFRVSAIVPEYNEGAIALLKKFDFVQEVCRRKALERDGRRWDLYIFGLLNDDWQNRARPEPPR